MRAPPKHPKPLSRETRWLVTQIGAVALGAGLLLTLVGVILDWGLARIGVAIGVAIVGLTMLDKQLARDVVYWLRNSLPFLQDVTAEEREADAREIEGLTEDDQPDPPPRSL